VNIRVKWKRAEISQIGQAGDGDLLFEMLVYEVKDPAKPGIVESMQILGGDSTKLLSRTAVGSSFSTDMTTPYQDH